MSSECNSPYRTSKMKKYFFPSIFLYFSKNSKMKTGWMQRKRDIHLKIICWCCIKHVLKFPLFISIFRDILRWILVLIPSGVSCPETLHAFPPAYLGSVLTIQQLLHHIMFFRFTHLLTFFSFYAIYTMFHSNIAHGFYGWVSTIANICNWTDFFVKYHQVGHCIRHAKLVTWPIVWWIS